LRWRQFFILLPLQLFEAIEFLFEPDSLGFIFKRQEQLLLELARLGSGAAVIKTAGGLNTTTLQIKLSLMALQVELLLLSLLLLTGSDRSNFLSLGGYGADLANSYALLRFCQGRQYQHQAVADPDA
jgi:hypothetical protein